MKKLHVKILIGLSNIYFLFMFVGCKKQTLLFPSQIPLDVIELSDRGPVKQNTFRVITEDDEKVKFDLKTADREVVESIFFSYVINGKKKIFEIKDFDNFYVIDSLPLNINSKIDVWAKSKNGLDSKTYTYNVRPFPFPYKNILKNITISGEVKKIAISITNLTRSNALLYYKIGDSEEFTEVDLPISSSGQSIVVKNLIPGDQLFSYYLKDDIGGQSDIVLDTISVRDYTLVHFNTAESRAGWTPYASNSHNAAASPVNMLDFNLSSIWHTQWSTTTTSTHRADQKYPFTLIFTFTRTRATSASRLFNEESLRNPNGPFSPIIIKNITLLQRSATDKRVKDIQVFGIQLDGTEVHLGDFTLSNERQDNVLSFTNNETVFKGVRIVCLNTHHATDRFANLNEIYVSGYDEF